MTRSPMRWARQQKSRSSRKSGSEGSKPARASQTSRRTSIPAELTASTSRMPSCWPWSCSRRSSPVTRRPEPVTVTPASRSRRRSCQPRILGPRTATLGLSSAVSSSRSRQCASGALSSCRSHTQETASGANGSCVRGPRWSSPARTAWPKPTVWSRRSVRSAPNEVRSRSGLASTEPVSTPTAASGSRVWAASVVSTAGSHTAPSWLTTTAVTWCSRRGRAGTSSSRAR